MKTEGKHTLEFLLSDGGSYSYDAATVAAAASAIQPGTLMGKITASGKWVAYSDAANDGSEVARGIARNFIPDLAADQKQTLLVRHAQVMRSELTGLDANGEADLKAIGIIVRG